MYFIMLLPLLYSSKFKPVLGRYPSVFFFFHFFHIEILAKYNKNLEKLVESILIKQEIPNFPNFFVEK
jgi:hypothetical protein